MTKPSRIVSEEVVKALAVGEPFVLKIVRTDDRGTFEIYDDEGLFLVYPFDSIEGESMQKLFTTEGTTYHRARVVRGGEIGFEGEPLEDQGW